MKVLKKVSGVGFHGLGTGARMPAQGMLAVE